MFTETYLYVKNYTIPRKIKSLFRLRAYEDKEDEYLIVAERRDKVDRGIKAPFD